MEKKQRLAVVAGATGYLGRFLTTALHGRGYRVRALVRRREQEKLFNGSADEVFVGSATEPDSLQELMDGADIAVSSLGITRQRDGLSYEDVDYGANLNLLRLAEAAGSVRRFGYVSVFRGPELRGVKLVDAKERFVQELERSTLSSLVVRPTGFFSDMKEFLGMARKGRGYVFGDGSIRFNPIHGADLAEAIADAMETSAAELDIGGPDVFSMEQIVCHAFAALERPARITRLPDWTRRLVLWLLPRTTPLRVYGPIQFFLAAAGLDMAAPPYGTRRLRDYFREEARKAAQHPENRA